MRTRVWRLVAIGLLAALVVAALGRALERTRFGSGDDEALARIERELRERFDASATTLGAIAERIASERAVIHAAVSGPAGAGRLFDVVEAAMPDEQAGRTGITVYEAPADVPLAWAGRASDLPKQRLDGPAALFVAPGALGPRLVRVEPVGDRDRLPGSREATIVVEQSLAGVQGAPGAGDTFVVSTAVAPVALRAQFETGSTSLRSGGGNDRFVIPSASGGLLVEAEVAREDIKASRDRWHSRTWAAVASILALTLLLGAGPVIDLRRQAREASGFVLWTAALAGNVLLASAVLWFAGGWILGTRTLDEPLDVLLTGLAAVALVRLGRDLIERRRIARPRPRLVIWGAEAGASVRLAAAYLVAGLIDAWLLAGYERYLEQIVSATALDVLHFSLHPIDAPRLAVAFGLVLLHASVIWSAALVIRLAGLFGRASRRWVAALGVTGSWLLGVSVGTAVVGVVAPDVPIRPLFVALAAAGGLAAAVAKLHERVRRASQAVRFAVFFVALLVPAIATYPSLASFASDAKERLVADQFGPQALTLREDLKQNLVQTLDQIDEISALPRLVSESSPEAPPTTDSAFLVWSKTELARYRLTSAVELYGANGRLVSRFALNLPEYTTYPSAPHLTSSCDWELFEEVVLFGASENHTPRASRGLCEDGVVRGSIVVRVMLDYRTLPFISSQSPYLDSLRPARQPLAEGVQGRDVEFVVYGWSRAPIFASRTSVWPLTDPIFQRMIESRGAFWDTLTHDGDDQAFRVYFLNDRGGIYALGYPVITWFGHLINLAELVVLVGVLFLAVIAGGALFVALGSRAPVSGRALFREVRSSFYWKVFLASLAVAVLPVVTLAIATRTYFARQFSGGITEEAAKTATVAQRLVEDYATLQQRGTSALAAIDDEIMVLVGRAIDQDVNLFDRSRLQATSQRDLFASQILSTRTPGPVYQRIILQRLPTFVGVEKVDDFPPYLIAAAPVRAGGREGIVTVPLTLRQVEIERQIDELDRQVLFGAVLFSLLGAAIGYWMADRIADPVNRLSRATRRIARGDLDARIATASADELGRLVQDFNRMAADLKRQRSELERTQRLEAWAEMARQVAHDIKNPLTPIQLSAEHARRINIDRGRPLSPVLDECVNAILSQVALLRQIAAEFSSFASSPTARPESTRLQDLIEDVAKPYRTGLSGRIDIDIDTPEDLPAVFVDRKLLSRAITNVIENALHAMPGQGKMTIRSRQSDLARGPSRMVTIEIADTGVGLDPEALGRLFEPYFSTKATGTGLGLTIAKRNIELNGGTIDVTSRRGIGTTVTISLPVAGPPHGV